MNRKKHFLLILVALVLSFTLTFSLVACNRETGEEKVEVDEKALVANGTFVGVESEVFPKVPSNWSAAAGSTGGSQATPSVQGKDVISGVISVNDAVYKDNAKKWKLPKDINPYKPNDSIKDNSILMINNLVKTSYRYTSSSINIEKDSYYKIDINVMTQGEAEAYLYVLGDAFAEFKAVKTNGQWATYTVYIEGAKLANKSVSITLSNGWGDKVNGNMSEGAVFFDEIVATKLEKKDDANFGKNTYNAVIDDSTTNKIAKYSMQMSDTEFDYTSGSTLPYSPSKYRGYPGSSDTGNNAPTGSSYVNHGVIDTALDYSTLGLGDNVDLAPGSMGTKMLFINNIKRTAYGYRSSVPFVVEAGKEYVFTAKIKTANITGNGATVRLVESSTDTNKNNAITNINTNGEWTDIMFNITGNQLSNKEIYFEIWLGEGGVADESKWTTGTVFMDKTYFAEKISVPAPEVTAFASATLTQDVNYSEEIDSTNNIINNGYIMNENTTWQQMAYDKDRYNFYNETSHSIVSSTPENVVPLPADKINVTNKDAGTSEELNSVLKIALANPTAYGIVITNGDAPNKMMVAKNSYYKISMWVKTDLAEKYDKMGLNVRLMQVVKDKKDDETDKNIASFDNVNTRKVETNNGYVQLTFYVEGANDKAKNDAEELYLEVMLGSGSRFTPETHVQGNAYIALVGMEPISHSDYVKASTTNYTKKNSLSSNASETTTVSNGNFTSFDVNATYDNYINYKGDNKLEEDEIVKNIIKDGEFVVPTAPVGWSISNKAYLEALTTGIVSTEEQFAKIQDNKLGVSYDNFKLDANGNKVVNGGALVIATKKAQGGKQGVLTVPTSPETCGCTCEECKKNGICTGSCGNKDCKCLHKTGAGVLPVGYTSSSISLSADSYYMIKVMVKAGSNSTGRVYLTNNQSSEYIEVSDTTDWQTVTFYVNTGLSATSVKLELYLGEKKGTETVTGAVAFENASFHKIDKEAYEAATSGTYTKVTAYETDSFDIDNPSEESLTAPNNWTGNVAKDGSTESANLAKGVFDKDYTRSEWLYTTDKESGQNTYLPNDVYRYLIDNENDAYKNFLVINNITPNGYSYTNTSDSKTLTKDAYYTISVDVLTYGLKETETAYVSLKLNNVTYTFDLDDESKVKVNTSTYADGKETLGVWTNYEFLVKTPKNTTISNVTITLGLGKASDDKDNKTKNFVQGYAFFDNVKFSKATKEGFEAAKDDATTKVIAATDEEMLKPEEPEKKPEEKPKNNLLWLYITSGVIGGLIIIVVIVVLIKKFWPQISKAFNKKKGKNMANYDKNNPNTQSDNAKSGKNNKEFKD